MPHPSLLQLVLQDLLNQMVRRAGWAWAAASLLLGLLLWQMWWQTAPLQPNPALAQLAFTPGQFWRVLGGWGDAGLALYRQHFMLDHGLALSYGAWGALAVAGSGLFDGLSSRRRWLLAGMLPAATVFDLLENAAHLALLALPQASNAAAMQALALAAQPPGVWLVPLASMWSLLKWLLLLGFALVFLWRAQRVWGPWLAPRLELKLPPLALALGCALLMAGLAWAWPEWRLGAAESAGTAGQAGTGQTNGLVSGASRAWTPWLTQGGPLALALAGAALALTGVRTFRRLATSLNPLAPSQASTLVAVGVYRWSRNPMYLGMVLVLTGWAAWLAHPLAAALVPAFIAWLTRFQIVPEERALAARFGPAFRLYCQQVRRWL